MKKIILGVLALVMAVSLTGCGKPSFLQKKAEEVAKDAQTVAEEIANNTTADENSSTGAQSEDQQGILSDDLNTENSANEDGDNKKLVFKPQQTLLILDASGSMWGKIDGRAKIDIAKEVTKKTVAQFKDTELGLMAYGHRRKGDCKDIEILTAPKKDNAENISKMVDGISPKGMTPMGNSVLQAAESLKYTEQKATVILISDGIETCDVDLCALGKKLETIGIDFTAHVIGFDMTEEQTAGLKCLASETGGTFTLAKNADDLGRALEKTVEASSCSKEKLGEATITAPKEIFAGSDFKVEFTGPKNENDNVSILPKDSTDGNEHLDYFYTQNDPELRAPVEAGEYDIVYFANCGAILGRTSIIVQKVSANITAPAEVGAGSDFKVEFTGPKNDTDNISILPKGSTDRNAHLDYFYPATDDSELRAPLEPSEYDIVYFAEGEKELARTTFKAVEVSASITAPAEVGAGSDFKVKFTGPKNDTDNISILPKGSTDRNAHFNYFYPANDDPELEAPLEPGEYDIVYFAGGDKELARTTFKLIEASASISAPAEVKAETYFEIKFTGPKNSSDNISIMPKGSTDRNDHLNYFYPETGDPELKAPDETGVYDIVYWLRGEKELARTTINVTN
jgi:Ca-activated chloride channel family protein